MVYVRFGLMDPNTIDADGNTPLHIAAARGLLPVVIWLVEKRGALLTVVNLYGHTPHGLAMINNRPRTTEYIATRLKTCYFRRPQRQIRATSV